MNRTMAFLVLTLAAAPAWAIDTTFTYQGSLTDAGQPANGSYDLQFTLVDNRPVAVVPPIALEDVPVSNGVFTVVLDFGPTAFTGADRFLQIGVRPGNATRAHTLLTPNTAVRPAPYSQLAADALFAASVDDNTISTAKIVDGAVGTADLAANAVTSAKIADLSITDADIAANTITGASILDVSISAADIGSDAVTSAKIANASIVSGDIAVNTIVGANIANQTITDLDIAGNTITGSSILNGTLTATDVASNTFWQAGGNAGTNTANHFLGTNDSAPLRLQAGGGVGVNIALPGAPFHVDAPSSGLSAGAELARFSPSSDERFSIGRATAGGPEIQFHNNGIVGSIGVAGEDVFGTASMTMQAEFSRLSLSYGFGTTTLALSDTAGSGPQFVVATKPGGGAWSAPSDRRLKHDVQQLTNSLDRLLQLRGVSFEYNDTASGKYPAGTQTGFVAQDVQKVFPSWVNLGPDGFLLVGAKGFEALAVEALRELRAEKDQELTAALDAIAQLRRDNAELRAANAGIRSDVDALKARLSPRLH